MQNNINWIQTINQSINQSQENKVLKSFRTVYKRFKLFRTLPNLSQNFSADLTQQSSIHFYYTKISEPDGWRIPFDRWISRSPLVFTLFLRQPFCHLNCFIREGRPVREVSVETVLWCAAAQQQTYVPQINFQLDNADPPLSCSV